MVALASLLAACSGGDPTSPGDPGDGTPVTVLVEFHGTFGTLSATANGKTYSSSPGFIEIPSGTDEISGTFNGSSLEVDFGGFTDRGGVEFDSIKSLAGPNPNTSRCSVVYTRTGTGSSAFRIQFKVVTKVGGHC